MRADLLIHSLGLSGLHLEFLALSATVDVANIVCTQHVSFASIRVSAGYSPVVVSKWLVAS